MLKHLFLAFLFISSLAGAEEFLDPAVAFKPYARFLDGQTIEVRYDIAKGYYLYRDKFRFVIDDSSSRLGTPRMPKGKEKNDENFGKVEVYYKEAVIQLPLERATGENSSAPLNVALKLTSQGCADAGVCYPPQTQVVNLELPAAGAASASESNAGDESGQIARTLKDAGFWANLAFFFVAGLGLALTPCVFPMIPILSGIIAGQGEKISRGKGFALSLAYVLGMAVTYATVGIAAGLTGSLLSNALQNPWVLGAFALVFVALSFSMFGFYELQLPTALQSKLSEEAGHLHGGHGLAVFVMGALSALIVGPCVAAPLAGALLYIGQTHDAWLGGSALFVMAFGMGVPLLIVGLSAGALLPRAGAWMEAVKKSFGVVLLGTALWLVSPVIPVAVQMLAWAGLLIIPATYLHALDPLPPHAKGWHRFWKGVGIIMLLTGAALLIGTLAGNRDPLQPLSGLRGAVQASEAAKIPFQRIVSLADLDRRLQSAGRPVMLDFYADWCVSCKEMERFTFADSAVRTKMEDFILLKADVTANNDDDKALMARFGLFGPPGILFFGASGQEIKGLRVVGFQDAATFGEILDKAKQGSQISPATLSKQPKI